MSLKIFEVIQWGNEDEGPNGLDTILLVIAHDYAEAGKYGICGGLQIVRVDELGEYTGRSKETGPIRGPYRAAAYNYGRKSWLARKDMKVWTWGPECYVEE